MVVRKLSPRDQFSIPLLQRKSEEVCRCAADTVRAAVEHLHRSKAAVSQSELILERAKDILRESSSRRSKRVPKSGKAADSSGEMISLAEITEVPGSSASRG